MGEDVFYVCLLGDVDSYTFFRETLQIFSSGANEELAIVITVVNSDGTGGP